MKRPLQGGIVLIAFLLSTLTPGFAASSRPLPNLDRRSSARSPGLNAEQGAALGHLRELLAGVQVDFDPLLQSPRRILAKDGFLTGPNAQGHALAGGAVTLLAPNDPHRAIKLFLAEHRGLFGFGPEALDAAAIKSDYIAAHNGLHTVVWEQQLDGIPIFEALLISHTTKRLELATVSSRFFIQPARAADAAYPKRALLVTAPPLKAADAVARAGHEAGDALSEVTNSSGRKGARQHQRFRANGLKDEADARLVWLPMDAEHLRLCWEIVFVSGSRDEMFQSLVDVETGEVLVRNCRTSDLTPATYNVYTSDSPTPFSPGFATPNTNQPPYVSRVLVTTSALSTNASPAGWINDGDNKTRGNNVDAHLDRNADNQPDLPSAQGSPARVFDFAMDLSQSPTNYSAAAVVNLFYWCNWMHDRLYDLGFTEAAGNFQETNFNRGGLEGDSVQADAQDGGGSNNANFHTTPDGTPGSRMQLYLWTRANPNRDGSLDAELILHEYTHGLSNRRVGGGVGMTMFQERGMGEGWSDFFALSLLSEPGDDPDAAYAAGGYSAFGTNTSNYYYGIRRFPYSTDLSKNPLTLKDIDPAAADMHDGVPRAFVDQSDEVHNQGEVWCATLWEARASMIHRYGGAGGNQLMLQLVIDALPLTPPHPTYIEARDAILLADLVNNGGTNQPTLWAAFAKRGMGTSATVPVNSVFLIGVHESYDLPDGLVTAPLSGFSWSGTTGQSFPPTNVVYALTNAGSNGLTWSATKTASWLNLSATGGTLPPGSSTQVIVALDSSVTNLPTGAYSDHVLFSNVTSGQFSTRPFEVRVEAFATLPFNDGFENGSFGPSWLATGAGPWRTQVTSQNGPRGSFHVTMDSSVSNLYAINELTLGVNLDGYTNVMLTFWGRDYGEEAHSNPVPFENRADMDGVYVSTDGFHWFRTQILRGLASAYGKYAVNLDYAVRSNGLAYTSTFRIRFNQYDNNPIFGTSLDGMAFDDVEVTGRLAGQVDHFAVSSVTPTQLVSEPFAVRVTARDAFDRTVTNFNGPANLTTLAGPLTAQVFADDFEDGNFSDWIIGTGPYIRAITNDVAAGGTNSFMLIGGTGNSRYNGISQTLPNLTPKQINFSVRAAQVNKYGGYFNVGTAANDSSQAAFFYMRSDGSMGLAEDQSGSEHLFNYTSNQWYAISLAIDWSRKRIDFFVNGTLMEANIPFRNPAVNSLTRVYLYNFDPGGQFWWDEIEFVNDAITPTVPMTPATATTFSNGVWVGNVRISSPGTNFYLQASDGAHAGYGNTFNVLAFVDSDGDGMPDDWEDAHGLNRNDPADGAIDADADGMSNLEEYWAGTDPRSAASALRFSQIELLGGSLRFKFPGIAGKLYQLEASSTVSPAVWTIVRDAIEGADALMPVAVSVGETAPARFYRVVLVR